MMTSPQLQSFHPGSPSRPKRPISTWDRRLRFAGGMIAAVLWLAVLGSGQIRAQVPGMMGGGNDQPELAPVVKRQFAPGQLEAMSTAELQTLYRENLESLRQTIKDLLRSTAEFYHATSDQAYLHQKTWREAADRSDQQYARIKELSLEFYLRVDNPDRSLSLVARRMALRALEDGQLSTAAPALSKLAAQFPKDDEIQLARARVAAMTNKFDLAAEYAESHQSRIRQLPIFDKALFGKLTEHQLRWAGEQELREQEAQSDDLPRVELITTKGRIVIELFENQAPHTVGNFVSLIQSGFYEGLAFHEVIRNYRAEGGIVSPTQGIRTTGYKIEDESQSPNARHVFRGSVSLVNAAKTRGASHFYINITPEPFVAPETRDTVIGRVIEGMEVVESLNVTGKMGDDARVTMYQDAQPDKIISADTVRLRPDTKYEPKIIEP